MPILKLGIIGYGGFGRFLHHSWDAMPDVEVAAVSDSDPDRQPSGPAFFTRWDDLIERADVDLVCIATPPHTHAEIACAAMEAGRHVLIEKPLALSMADAERIVAVQELTQRDAAVNFMLRFNPIVETIHTWSLSQCFGRLRRVLVENYAGDDQLSPDHWFWDREQSGGILVEHAVHFIDVVAGCTEAEPVRIDGLALSRDDGRQDRMGLTVIYEDGLVVSQYHAFSRPGFFEQTNMRFVFDLAQVDVEGWIPLSGKVTALVNSETEPELNRLPGFTATEHLAIRRTADGSRPEASISAPRLKAESPARDAGRPEVRSSGESFEIEAHVTGSFEMPIGKPEAYAAALRAHLTDVRRAIAKPGHRLRVKLTDSVAGLSVALEASRKAFSQ
jgi:predicted dehydrogenase